MIHVRTGAFINPPNFNLNHRPTQYPSEWFEKGGGRKPTVNLRHNTLQPGEMRGALIRGIAAGKLDKEIAKIYLSHMGGKIKGVLDAAWRSYGINIGQPTGEVSVLSILDIKITDQPLEETDTHPDDPTIHDQDILLAILFIHRLNRLSGQATVEVYYELLTKQLKSKDSLVGRNITRLFEYITYNWKNDSDYNKLVAAYDMFLFKFKDHEMSALRLGTVTSRYRDCAGITSYNHLCDLINLPAEEVKDWVFTKQAATDINQIFKESDLLESRDPYSYFPYQADLGLVVSSSYSSVATPSLFFLIHAVGSLMKSRRSINARIKDNVCFNDLVMNAIIIAYRFKKSGVEKSNKTTTTDNDEERGDNRDCPMGNASECILFMKKRGFKLTKGMESLLSEYKREIRYTREGTMGRFMSEYF